MVAVAIVVAFAMFATTALAYTHSVTLRQGSSGAQVMSLQQALGGLVADGAFGPLTKAAVMAYQASHGLVADGVVGPLTGASIGGAVSGNFPAGCTSAAGYSPTTGVKCDSGPSMGLPAGCSSTSGYSVTTGVKCDSSTSGGGAGSGLTGGAGSITLTAS